jgi:hypothetical protein
MRDLVRLIVWAVVDLLRSRAAIEAEILTLRQQIIVLRRTAAKKQTFGAGARRKLNPGILVMQPAQDWATKNVPGVIDGARDRCILLQG